jgi:hypothetical protein
MQTQYFAILNTVSEQERKAFNKQLIEYSDFVLSRCGKFLQRNADQPLDEANETADLDSKQFCKKVTDDAFGVFQLRAQILDFLRGKENVVGQPHAAIYVEKAFRLIRWALGSDPEKMVDSVRSDVEILSRSPHELVHKLTIARIEEPETFKTNDHVGWEALSRGSRYVMFRLEPKVLSQKLGIGCPETVKVERQSLDHWSIRRRKNNAGPSVCRERLE